jgi:hypothetical protein
MRGNLPNADHRASSVSHARHRSVRLDEKAARLATAARNGAICVRHAHSWHRRPTPDSAEMVKHCARSVGYRWRSC